MLPLRKYPALRGIFLLTRPFFKCVILCRSKRVSLNSNKTSFLKVETVCFLFWPTKNDGRRKRCPAWKDWQFRRNSPAVPCREYADVLKRQESSLENCESGRDAVRGFESYHLRFYVDVLKRLRGLIANQLEPLCGAWVRSPPSTISGEFHSIYFPTILFPEIGGSPPSIPSASLV